MPVLITSDLAFNPDPVALADLMRSPHGDMAKDLIRRADHLVVLARRQITGGGIGGRLGHVRAGLQDMGGGARPNLRDTVKKRTVEARDDGLELAVGSDLAPLALWHHEGTKPHVIVPRRANTLVFVMNGRTVYRKRVNHPGTKPNRYLTDNLPAVVAD